MSLYQSNNSHYYFLQKLTIKSNS